MKWSSDMTPPMTSPVAGLTFNFWGLPARMILEDILSSRGARAEADDAFLFELSHDFDDALLCGMHVLHFDGSHKLHFFFHHFNGAARHIAEELVLLLLGRALEGLGNGF